MRMNSTHTTHVDRKMPVPETETNELHSRPSQMIAETEKATEAN